MKALPKLFKRTSLGQIQEWSIFSDGGNFWTEEGIQGGKITKSEPTICEGKNLGKKNESLPNDQSEKESFAKHKKKIKEGYWENIEDIDKETFFEPMLCKQYEDYWEELDFSKGVAVEGKLNGIRLILNNLGGFSRKGEQFFCINHIQNILKPILDKYPNIVLDGELFNPILKNELNKIAKLVSVNRKAKDVTLKNLEEAEEIIQYHIYDAINYDGITKDTPFIERKDKLKNLLMGIPCCFYHPYKIVHSNFEVQQELKKTKEEGSEGLVIKILNSKYENKRSRNFLKLKNWIDEEFKILGFKEGTGNWRGCCKMVTCQLNQPSTDGRNEFDSNIEGTMEDLRTLWNEKDKHINKKCTVTFQEYSVYKIPLIPYTSLPFRDYE